MMVVGSANGILEKKFFFFFFSSASCKGFIVKDLNINTDSREPLSADPWEFIGQKD